MKPLLFASGDVGGARALLPVIRLAAARGQPVSIIANGAIQAEGDASWAWLSASDVTFADRSAAPEALIFASSLTDATALRLARQARAAGVLTIHVLDSWATYADRMRTDGDTLFLPDVYCVPDTLAAQGAIDAGIAQEVIAVTGQPAFGDVTPSQRPQNARGSNRSAKILLVSEPVEFDQGPSRGYTEEEALGLVISALQDMPGDVEVCLLPHPRDNREKVERFWAKTRGTLAGQVLVQNSLGSLGDYDGVAGMASVLLYRAWLMGMPVLSSQPGLRLAALRQFGGRPGIVMIDSMQNAHERVRAWARDIAPGAVWNVRPEAKVHQEAAERILAIASTRAFRA